jgi:hypothetical protein
LGKVTPFIRISRQLVKLVRISRTMDEFPSLAPDHHDWGDSALGEIFAECEILHRLASAVTGRSSSPIVWRSRRLCGSVAG